MATLKPTDYCLLKRINKYHLRYDYYVYRCFGSFFKHKKSGPGDLEFGYVNNGKNYKNFYIVVKDYAIKKISCIRSSTDIKNIPLWRKRYLPKIRCGSCIHKHSYKLTGECKETYKWRH